MKPKHRYLLLAVAGAVIPYAVFVPWLMAHGLDFRLFVQELFANRISAFFGLDVVVSAGVLAAWARVERRRLRPRWLPVVAVLAVGISLGLPLMLYLRELAAEQQVIQVGR